MKNQDLYISYSLNNKKKSDYQIINNKNTIQSNISILWNLISDKINWDSKYDKYYIKLNGYIYLRFKAYFYSEKFKRKFKCKLV